MSTDYVRRRAWRSALLGVALLAYAAVVGIAADHDGGPRPDAEGLPSIEMVED